jgi:DNA-binding transcriptional LysR family regulator
MDDGNMVKENQEKLWAGISAFHAVAITSNLSVAAREFGLSQPAFSRRISAFERELGIKLFRRESRGVSLTPEGVQLFSVTRQAFVDLRSKMAKAIPNPPSRVRKPATASIPDATTSPSA